MSFTSLLEKASAFRFRPSSHMRCIATPMRSGGERRPQLVFLSAVAAEAAAAAAGPHLAAAMAMLGQSGCIGRHTAFLRFGRWRGGCWLDPLKNIENPCSFWEVYSSKQAMFSLTCLPHPPVCNNIGGGGFLQNVGGTLKDTHRGKNQFFMHACFTAADDTISS